jgi:hypothetical protein
LEVSQIDLVANSLHAGMIGMKVTKSMAARQKMPPCTVPERARELWNRSKARGDFAAAYGTNEVVP